MFGSSAVTSAAILEGHFMRVCRTGVAFWNLPCAGHAESPKMETNPNSGHVEEW